MSRERYYSHSKKMRREENHMLTRLSRMLALSVLFAAFSVPALASKKTEEEWIAQLASADEGKVTSALQGLEKEYPESPTARAKIISMLKDPREKVQRKAARVLGAINAKVDAKVLADITPLLKSTNKDAVVDGLKALRGLDAASTVPQILPLLSSPDENIKRDACRTLADIADPSVISKIEPLLSDANKKVQEDARTAIAKLKMKQK
jgi:HEAT repeat protein